MFKKLAILVLFVVVSSTTLFSQTYPTITLATLSDQEYELIEVEDEYIIVEVNGVFYVLKKSF